MTVPLLQTRVFYGLKTDIIGNVHYITDNDVLYPVGNALAIHNFYEKHQRLLRLPDKYRINIIAVTPNKKYVALCEVGDKPTISIYDIQSLRRRKTLGIPYDCPDVKKFTCISFSFDNKYLAAVTDVPDQTMLFYAWEKGKVESTLKVLNPQQGSSALVHEIACNPGDMGLVALAGRFAFKFLTCSETIWRPYGFSKAENLIITSIAWLNSDRLLAGTSDGRMLFLENGELKSIFKIKDITLMNLKLREDFVLHPSVETTTEEIRCLTAFQKGFAFGLGPGRVLVFERDGPHKFINKHILMVPKQVTKDPESTESFYTINSIASNLSSDHLVVTSGWAQLFFAKLWTSTLMMDVVPEDLNIMGQALHHGRINSLSMCAWKSIFMTSGDDDRSVRLWDFESESLVMFKQYQENVYSVALHPIGLFCLIGFTDKLRFMTISIDDLLTMQEFSIRACRIVKFSNGGHFFAAVNGHVIQVYTTIDFSTKFLLKGHTGKISTIIWSQPDFKLVSMGLDGAIYTWDMTTGLRTGEIILKNVLITGVGLTSDASSIHCVVDADSHKLYEIKDDSIIRELPMKNQVTSLLLGKKDTLMFATCPGGIILSFKLPLLDPLDLRDFHIHSTDVANLSLSFNEQNLISAGIDGSLCFWKVVSPDVTLESDQGYTSEILIGKSDLGDKIQLIQELTIRIKELDTEATYKIRQIEVQHNDKMRQVHQGYCEAIEELKSKIDKLHEDRTNELNTINSEISNMKSAHEKSTKEMEISNDAKLIAEYDKYSAFEVKNNAMREAYEEKLKELEASRAAELEQTVKKYEALLHEKGVQLQEFHEEMSHQVRLHERIKDQIEDDADREIVEMRSAYETLLFEERQANLKLKGEAGVLRNKYSANQKEIEDLKRNVGHYQGEQHQYQKTIDQLEKDALDLKGEISERDSAIQEKEKSIYELKRSNQELEKYKFVLNYKIVELKNQIEPKDDEIKELKDKLQTMEAELLSMTEENKNLQLEIGDLKDKLMGIKQEAQSEVQKNRNHQMLIKKVQKELADAARVIQEPHALKVAVKNLYNRYCDDKEMERNRGESLEVECELIRQRDHLERTVESLKRPFRKKKES